MRYKRHFYWQPILKLCQIASEQQSLAWVENLGEQNIDGNRIRAVRTFAAFVLVALSL